ncbi:unnamed protein product [Cunninghamella echinulata]
MADYSYETFLNPLDALAFDIANTTSEINQQNAAAELALWTNAEFTFDVKPGTGIFDDEKSISSPIVKTPITESVNPLETTITNSTKTTTTEKNTTTTTTTTVDDHDPITYEKLVNYLDFELPQQQQKKQQEQKQQQYQEQKLNSEGLASPYFSQQQESFPSTPISTVPNSPLLATSTTVPHVSQPSSTSSHLGGRQILPKPVMINPLDLASLLVAPLQFNHGTTMNPLTTTSPILTPTINLTKKSRKKATTTPTATTTAGVKRDIDEAISEEDKLAEEDKRRRNTAASARFRIKKKLREQAMEQSVRDMTQKSEKLQERVNELELEVKLLRSLLTEKEMTTNNV